MTSLLSINDTWGEYPPSYYTATAKQLALQPRLQGNIKADICIIGGGYTGLSAAYHAAKLGYNVVLLEAHRVGWGASGRNGGHLSVGQRLEQPELEKLVGNTQAKALWQLSVDAVALCHQLIEKHAIDAELTQGAIHANHRARFNRHSEALVEHMHRYYDYQDIEYIDQPTMQTWIKSKAFHGGTYDKRSGHCHPLKFAFGVARAALEAGAVIYENSVVTAYESNAQGVRVMTSQGDVEANQLLLCCNGYLDQLAPAIDQKVMPINNFLLATEPLSTGLAQELIRNNAAVSDSRFVVNYFRLSQDNRLIFGGGETYGYRFPKNISQYVQKRMLKIYPQLADTRIDYSWGGTLAITMSRLPHFQRLGQSGGDARVYNASGYSGQGVALSIMAGKIMAEAIDGDAAKFDLMRNIPQPNMPGGRWLRWPILVLAMTYYAMLDRL